MIKSGLFLVLNIKGEQLAEHSISYNWLEYRHWLFSPNRKLIIIPQYEGNIIIDSKSN